MEFRSYVRGSCPTYIFGRGRIYGRSDFCSVRAVAHQRGEGGGHGNGHGRVPHEGRARAEIPTTHLHTYCVLLRTYSAPKTRIARAPELVAV